MNNSLLRLGLLGGLLAIAGCGAADERVGAPADQRAHAHHARELTMNAGALTGHSIYHFDSEWWNQHGEFQPLESLAGKVQVISMVYTHCSYTCPRILGNMKRLEAELEAAHADDVGFVLVSLDPERDTPERLASFAAATHLAPDRWTLLGGEDDAVLELATLLGIKYRRESATDFSHSNVLLVLNPAGEIVYRQVGFGEEPAPLLQAIHSAISGWSSG